MKLINANPSVFPQVTRLFDDFLTKDFFEWNSDNFSPTNTTIPGVNILDKNDGFLIEMAAPGMKKGNFHIELKDNLLTISSEMKDKRELEEGERWVRREFSYQSFHRSLRLNSKVVDDANIKASYSDGILTLHVPKKKEAMPKPPRLIEIS